jgi:DNA-binding transcriptional MerR regulator
MIEHLFTIEDLAKGTGMTPRTIRFYVQKGLIPGPEGAGRAAFYTVKHLTALAGIRHLQSEGLSLEEIRQKLTLSPPSPTAEATANPRTGGAMGRRRETPRGAKAPRGAAITIKKAEPEALEDGSCLLRAVGRWFPHPGAGHKPGPLVQVRHPLLPDYELVVDGLENQLSPAQVRELMEALQKVLAKPQGARHKARGGRRTPTRS